MSYDADLFERTTTNRLEIADFLDSLSDEQWHAPTLCEGWNVHLVAAHFLQPMLVGFGQFVLASLRHRGNTDATVDHVTRQLARRERCEIIALLRDHATDRVRPPRVGAIGPFAETCIHLGDIARPLGLDTSASRADWLELLAYLTGASPAASLIDPHRIAGVTLRATDAMWSHGDGPEAAGTVEALGMAITGRTAALTDLVGPGLASLQSAYTRG